jgi:hypothetical protein
MSTDRSLYVGPYLTGKFEMVMVMTTIRACTNKTCVNHKDQRLHGDYCQKCGSPVGDVRQTTKKPSVDQHNIQMDIKERLCSPGGDSYYYWSEKALTHIWLPNIAIPGRKMHFDIRDLGFLALPTNAEQQQQASEIAKFETKFAKEIVVMRVTYGDQNIAMNWGVVYSTY